MLPVSFERDIIKTSIKRPCHPWWSLTILYYQREEDSLPIRLKVYASIKAFLCFCLWQPSCLTAWEQKRYYCFQQWQWGLFHNPGQHHFSKPASCRWPMLKYHIHCLPLFLQIPHCCLLISPIDSLTRRSGICFLQITSPVVASSEVM